MLKIIWQSFTKRKILLFSLAVLLILLPLAYLTLRYGKKTEAAWMDDNWLYRTTLTIGNTGSADSNKKVKFDIDTATLISAGKMQSDCGDSRFTDINGRVLKYYIDTSGGACNTTSTDYYVLVPTIHAGTTVLYHYYGNPSVQNGTQASQFSEATFTPTSGPTTGSEEQSPGPVAYWKFDEGYGTTANDSTQNNNDASLINSPTWQSEDMCISGKCLQFNGDNTSVQLTSGGNINYNNYPFSISMWFIATSLSNPDAPELFNQAVTGGWINVRVAYNDELEFQVKGPSGTMEINSPNGYIKINKWYHLTVVYDPDNSSRMYINGVQMPNTSTVNAGTLTKSGNTKIGLGFNSWEWNGRIDEVKIYPYARSAEQIKADYLAGLSGAGTAKGVAAALGAAKERAGGVNLSNGLVGYWKMDESSWTNDCSTATVIDSSGNGNNGKACPASTGPTGGAAGKFGNAGSFDGSDDYINTNTYFSTITSAITISVWVNPGATQVQYADIWGNHGEPYKGMVMQQDGANTNVFSWGYGDGSNWTSSGTTQLTANTWQHLVAVKDSSYCYIYVNGEEKNKGSCTTSIVPNSSLNFLIARGYASDRAFNGKIDEVRIYNRALSPREVRALYEWAPGPRVYLKLDEGSGTTANDSSGNNRAGTIFNALWSIGKFGKGLKLDGSGDYLQIPDF